MAIEFKLPELGENIETIQVLKVMVSKGDTISVDQPVLELETDKATIELPSSVEGVISDVHIEEGDELAVGALVFSLEGGNSAPASAPADAATPSDDADAAVNDSPEAAAATAPAVEPAAEPTPVAVTSFKFSIPELGENIDTIQVLKVLAAVGDDIAVDQAVLELETDKATIELPSSVSGVVELVHVREGDEVSVGDDVFTVKGTPAGVVPAAAATPAPAQEETPIPAPDTAPAEPAPVAPAPPVPARGKRSPAAPSVRKFAREIGIDISQVPGTGPLGRISVDDVKSFSKQVNASRPSVPVAAAPTAGLPSLPELPDFEKFGVVKRDKMSVIRRKTAEQMTMSWLMVPHVTIFESADVTELDALRKRYSPRAEESGGKLTVASMVVKIVAQALKVFPNLNASVDMVNREIVYKTYCNIGVAVDTERGLLVPVIKDVDKKSMIEVAAELTDIAARTRSGKVQMSDLEGGSFTVSNLGRTAGTHFTPIINYPEVAILGVGRMTTERGPEDGSPRKMLPLSLSFDHRAVDGADGSRFLAWIIEALKEPFLLSLGG